MVVAVWLLACEEEPGEAPLPPVVDPGDRPLPPESEPVIRVRIRRVTQRDQTVVLGRPGRRFLIEDDGAPATNLILAAPIRLSMGPRGWRLRDANGFRPDPAGLDALTFTPIDRAREPVMLDDDLFPGSIRVVAQTEIGPNTLDIVNVLPIESYLPGVLSGELFSHWELATFRAQAIAARSFALCEMHYWTARRHYDVTNTTASQVYEGASDDDRAHEAVNSTRGEVLLFDERVVPGYYSACCGGLAARAVDVIGPNPMNDIPPLHGRVGEDGCMEAPVYRWRVMRDRHTLEARLRAWARERGDQELAAISRLRSIEATRLNEHGRPVIFIIRADGLDEPVERPASTLREALNRTFDDVNDFEQELRSAFVNVTIHGASVVIDGRGFGHGAGLCQYGAQALAMEGDDYREIITWYYPGATVERAYD